jgi:type VII secretion integral membrane protein EccD
MRDVGAAELCRVSVVGERRRLDVALPVHVPFAELVPTLLRGLVGERANVSRPGDTGGWALQRLGDAPLSLSATVASSGIRHGEVLYLRPRDQAAPPLAVDDVVDGIADAAGRLPGRWSAAAGRAWTLLALGMLLAAGAVLAANAGPPWPPVLALCILLSVALVGAAGVASRAAGRPEVALVFALASSAYVFVAGLSLHGGERNLGGLGAAEVLVGAAAVMPVAAVAALLVPTEVPALIGVGVAAGCAVVACLVGLAVPGTGAAVAVSLAVLLAPVLPGIAFRLSGLPLPAVPSTRPELAQVGSTVPAAMIERGARRADQFVTSTLGGLCTVAVLAGTLVAVAPGWASMVLLGTGSLALTLRARHYPGRAQRFWTYGAGLALALEFAYAASVHGGQQTRAAVVVAVLALAGILAVAGPWSDRSRSPVRGRLADVVEVIAVVATLPVAVQVLGLYSLAMGLGG